jgi:hypothetical protein
MSSNLYWRPATSGQEILPNSLKHALRKLDQFDSLDREVGEDFIPVLRGMEAAGTEGATELIAAIEKHGSVELKEEW